MSNQSRPAPWLRDVRQVGGQPLARTDEFKQPQLALAFDRDEWELVVTLPRRVLLAAAASAPAAGRRTAEGIAGIEAIAAGLASPGALVREVVAAIYAESYPEYDEPSDATDVITIRTLAACRHAAEVVAARCGPAEASAYRSWLLHIAAVVSGVAQGVTEPARGSFVYVLDAVL